MKNLFKISFLALALSVSLTSCDFFSKKQAETKTESIEVDSNLIDSTRTDTNAVDSIKSHKDSTENLKK